MVNNTFYTKHQRQAGVIMISTVGNNINIQNNLLYLNTPGDIIGFFYGNNVAISILQEVAPYITSSLIGNNLMYNGNGVIASPCAGITRVNNLVNTNPLVVNLPTYDFRLRSTSTAINAGVDVGLTTDFLGNPIVGLPDIGAYEFWSSALSISSPVSGAIFTAPATVKI